MDDLRLQPRWIQENIPTVTYAGPEQKHPHQPVDQLLHDHRAPRQHAAAVSGREEDRSGLGAAPAPHLTPAADSRGVGGGGPTCTRSHSRQGQLAPLYCRQH